MADGTAISWAEATWNVLTGCTVLSPGCKRCYAMKLAGARLKNHWSRQGLTVDSKAGPVWTGEVRYNPEWLDQPLRWSRPRMIFVAAHSDIGHPAVRDEWRDAIFAVMALRPDHVYLVLTKRPDVLGAYLASESTRGRVWAHASRLAGKFRRTRDQLFAIGQRISNWPLQNVWVGTSAEDQPHLDERLPHLLRLPAALRWLSIEPMLGPVDLTMVPTWTDPRSDDENTLNALTGREYHAGAGVLGDRGPRIEWVVAGGESQNSDRPTHPDWVRSLRDQCQAAAVPFHFKQWGDWIDADNGLKNPHGRSWTFNEAARIADEGGWAYEHNSDGTTMIKAGARRTGRTLDGHIWDEFPARPPQPPAGQSADLDGPL